MWCFQFRELKRNNTRPPLKPPFVKRGVGGIYPLSRAAGVFNLFSVIWAVTKERYSTRTEEKIIVLRTAIMVKSPASLREAPSFNKRGLPSVTWNLLQHNPTQGTVLCVKIPCAIWKSADTVYRLRFAPQSECHTEPSPMSSA